jgi:hypothetical protein
VSGLRAGDTDRERTVGALREHMVGGRLTLEELAERSADAWTSATQRELELLVLDLRDATLEEGDATVFALTAFGATALSRRGRREAVAAGREATV